MNEDKPIKNKVIVYVIAFVVNGLITLGLLALRHIFTVTDKVLLYKYIADSFTITGLFPMLLAALIALSNEGSLDALGYMLKRLGKALIPFSKKDDLTYREYLQTRKRVRGYGFLFWVGLAYFIVAIIFIVLFFQVYESGLIL